jgi:FAD:protein FMN transferase
MHSNHTTMTLTPPASGAERRLFRHRWNALGTPCEIQFVCAETAQADAFMYEAVNWVAQFEDRYSRFRPESLLSKINAAAGRHWVDVDAEMDHMIGLCQTLHFMTRGVLDATALPLMRLWNYHAPRSQLPSTQEVAEAKKLVGWHLVQREPGRIFLPMAGMALDFGGWGKEFAVDAVAQLARAHGINDVLVDFGHDLRAIGNPPGKPAWHVGLEDPRQPGTYRGSLGIRDRGVACSGDYLRHVNIGGRRYGHIVDPRTGWPVANGCEQVTVVAPSCLQAGVLSTAAFILGPQEGLAMVQETLGAEALLITQHARHQTRGLFQYVVQS